MKNSLEKEEAPAEGEKGWFVDGYHYLGVCLTPVCLRLRQSVNQETLP
jgi:hypothetical protein